MGKIIEWNLWGYDRFAIAALFTIIALTPTALTRAQADDIQRFNLRIENGRVTDGGKVIAVKRGDRVEISRRGDRHMVLHLHGYDIEAALGPDKPATMAFNAHATGRFPVEAHPSKAEGKRGHMPLIHLEVHPR